MRMTPCTSVSCVCCLLPAPRSAARRRRISCSPTPTTSSRSAPLIDAARHRRRADRLQLEVAGDRAGTIRFLADRARPRLLERPATASCSSRSRTVSSRSSTATCRATCSRSPIYGGGLVPQADNPGENQPEGHGWVAQQWNPAVRERFQELLRGARDRSSMAASRASTCRRARRDVDIEERQDRIHLRRVLRGGAREHGVREEGVPANHTSCST